MSGVQVSKEKNSTKNGSTMSSKKSTLFYEKLDPDLPNFTSTKRLSYSWKTYYSLSFFIFSICYFVASVKNSTNDHYNQIGILLHFIGSGFYVICTSMKWWHYHRGCCSDSNLNSITKTNIDNSCSAKFNRAKIGLLYFISLTMSFFLFLTFLAIIVLTHFQKEERKKDKLNKFSNIIFISLIIILTIVQVLKFEKIANPTKQYIMLNDISNFFVEWFFLFGLFIYSLGLIGNVISSDDNLFFHKEIHQFFCIVGGLFFIISSLCLFFRFFCSDDSDLNMSFESNYSD